jgi:hypothetical protein
MGPLVANTGLNLTVLSHDGNVDIGIIACPDLVDDVGELADRFVDAVAALVAIASPPPDLGADMVDVADVVDVAGVRPAPAVVDLREVPDLPHLPRPTLAAPEGAG